MDAFEMALLVATLLCSLVTGFVFAFAVVVMPGIRQFSDRDFLRAFKLIDGVVQNNQPVFMLVWVGSVISLVIASMLSLYGCCHSRVASLVGAAVELITEPTKVGFSPASRVRENSVFFRFWPPTAEAAGR